MTWKNQACDGTPVDLARFVHSALRRRRQGLHTVVLHAPGVVEIMGAETAKAARFAARNPDGVVCTYRASMNPDAFGLTVREILGDIKHTIGCMGERS